MKKIPIVLKYNRTAGFTCGPCHLGIDFLCQCLPGHLSYIAVGIQSIGALETDHCAACAGTKNPVYRTAVAYPS